MQSFVLSFQEIDETKRGLVGAKAFNLGELARVEGLQVPDGFCVTAEAFEQVVGQDEGYRSLVEQLAGVTAADRDRIRTLSDQIRSVIEAVELPAELEQAIEQQLARLGEAGAYAVRSSATVEDLAGVSAAGQHDTYLNCRGLAEILQRLRQCWASLFSERAVAYRSQQGLAHRQVAMAVVIQRLVDATAAGQLFTADPVTSNRRVVAIDAGFGLGEAVVSGRVKPDHYKVRAGQITSKQVAGEQPVLSDAQILALEALGRKIEAHFGEPQDIEWCLADGLYIVQSRPITTLFPVPANDGQLRVYVSMGHQQMMTDAMKPLGLSFLELLHAPRKLHLAGGRPFIELTHDLASPEGRQLALATLGAGDPLIGRALRSLIERDGFLDRLPSGEPAIRPGVVGHSRLMRLRMARLFWRNDPAILEDLIAESEAALQALQDKLSGLTGAELFEFIVQDQQQAKLAAFNPRSLAVILVGQTALRWLNERLEAWLGETGVADTLCQAVANNVTSEMGLALLDVADVVRQYPAVMDYLHKPNDETFWTDLAQLPGGPEVSRALQAYLEKYGMRCTGEIDITRPRWSEQPTALAPLILSNIKNFEPGARERKLAEGRLAAEQKAQELLARLAQLPGGEEKVKRTKKMIRVLRNFIGYREYPKYALVQRYWLYKQALLKEADRLVQRGCLEAPEEIYYFTFDELREAVRTHQVDQGLIARRKAEHATYERLMPPRLLTSEGEVINGDLAGDGLPEQALVGVAVSAGSVEGRARVVLRLEEATLEEGDILVTRFTDPSWTPLFVSVKGLVTEVGGPMTHGAVIAREYGLPAVVSVENATQRIKDGQRIRVNGTAGYVELL